MLDARGNRMTYGDAGYRYYWNRNHPDAEAFYRQLVRFAVEEIRADLIHFDNYTVGPGYDACSVERFREYLRTTFSAEQLAAMGVGDIRVGPATRRRTRRSCSAVPGAISAAARWPIRTTR